MEEQVGRCSVMPRRASISAGYVCEAWHILNSLRGHAKQLSNYTLTPPSHTSTSTIMSISPEALQKVSPVLFSKVYKSQSNHSKAPFRNRAKGRLFSATNHNRQIANGSKEPRESHAPAHNCRTRFATERCKHIRGRREDVRHTSNTLLHMNHD